MTDSDLRFMQDCLKYLPDEEMRDRANLIILNAAADGIKLKSLKRDSKCVVVENCSGTIEFTSKEAAQIPVDVRKHIAGGL